MGGTSMHTAQQSAMECVFVQIHISCKAVGIPLWGNFGNGSLKSNRTQTTKTGFRNSQIGEQPNFTIRLYD